MEYITGSQAVYTDIKVNLAHSWAWWVNPSFHLYTWYVSIFLGRFSQRQPLTIIGRRITALKGPITPLRLHYTHSGSTDSEDV